MNKPMMLEAMTTSISEVLEQMFFLPLEIADAEASQGEFLQDEEMIVAHIGFHGSFAGVFSIMIPATLAGAVSADFLGESADGLPIDQVEGTVLEMINMLAGNALCHYDQATPFDLQLPGIAVGHRACDQGKSASDRITVYIKTIESRLCFELELT